MYVLFTILAQAFAEGGAHGMLTSQCTMVVCNMCVTCVCACVCACVYTFVGRCLTTKVFIGNLPATGRG